jgi:DNA transposition AAA+ family ATPase
MVKVMKTEELPKDEIAQSIRNYCEAKGLSQNELSAQTKLSSATISKILNGKWDDISDAVWRKLQIATSDGQVEVFYNTANHTEIKKLCDLTRKKKLMVGLTGDTGMGKTTSLKKLSRSRNTYYLSYNKTMKAKQFFANLLSELGVQFEGSVYDMVNRLADELNGKSNPLLIIDEAGKITNNVMLDMHVLRDKTNNNCGIVLAGMPYFKTNLIKNSNKQKEGYAEFFRRIQLWHELEGLSKDEILFICEQHGIEDKDVLKELLTKKRFGDLSNALLLHDTNY